MRDIDNLIRRVITERLTSQGMRFLSSPQNIGSARTSGIELEAKFLYGLWKFSATTRLRLSVNNLLAEDDVTARYLTSPNGYMTTSAHLDPSFGLRLEMKL